jgi:hypothetical protein
MNILQLLGIPRISGLLLIEDDFDPVLRPPPPPAPIMQPSHMQQVFQDMYHESFKQGLDQLDAQYKVPFDADTFVQLSKQDDAMVENIRKKFKSADDDDVDIDVYLNPPPPLSLPLPPVVAKGRGRPRNPVNKTPAPKQPRGKKANKPTALTGIIDPEFKSELVTYLGKLASQVKEMQTLLSTV